MRRYAKVVLCACRNPEPAQSFVHFSLALHLPWGDLTDNGQSDIELMFDFPISVRL